MSIIENLLIEFNLHDDFDDAKQDLIDKGIPLAEELDYYVASGGYGDVYKVRDKNKVLKIHQNEFEYETTNTIIDSGKEFDYVCKYYFNKWKEPFYVVVMEFLEEPSIEIERYMGRFIMNYSMASNNMFVKMTVKEKEKAIINTANFMEDDIIRKQLRRVLEIYGEEFYDIFIIAIHRYYEIYSKSMAYSVIRDVAEKAEIQQLFKDVHKGVQELKSIGVHNEDLHEGNILYDPKTKRYKIIDPMM